MSRRISEDNLRLLRQEIARSTYIETLGPFCIPNGFAATSTVQAQQLSYTGNIPAFVLSSRDPRVARPCRIVGLRMTSEENRVSGTATARIRINGVGSDFAGGACQLNATDVNRSAVLVRYSLGRVVDSAADIGCEVAFSGFGPTTADLRLWVTVRYAPFV